MSGFPRTLTFVTLGVRDLPALRAFYGRLGLDEAEGSTADWVAFDLGTTRLALYPLERLAREAAPGEPVPDQGAWNGTTLAVGVGSAEEVGRAYAVALAAGAAPVAPPGPRDWGGHSACFADPEGNRWEVSWTPGRDDPDHPPAGGHGATLAAMPSLAGAPPAVLAWLADHVTPVSFAAGERLVEEGGVDRDCWFIVSGRVEVTSGGRVLGHSGPGEPEGEMALFFRRPRGATATAVADVTALRLAAADYDALTTSSPALAQALMGAVMGHISRRFAQPRPPRPPQAES